MNEWTNERMNEWINEWMNEWMNEFLPDPSESSFWTTENEKKIVIKKLKSM